jgi:hypothetical protein
MRTLVLFASALLMFAGASSAQSNFHTQGFQCGEFGSGLCTDLADSRSYEGKYIGHDEPSVLFYSNHAGAGNFNFYKLKLPKDPVTPPSQDATGGTFNFMLHPAFWFGMAMCDTQSAPEFTTTCAPDSDANIFDSGDPTAPDFIGKHPGTAFMEMQFYPPGWVNGFDGFKYAAAITIDSFNQQTSPRVNNNLDCLNKVGLEPVNFGLITTTGVSQAPGDPLNNDPNKFAVIPGTTFLMNPGDTLIVVLHDTHNGFQVVIFDENTHQVGSMTASIANGFAQVNFKPHDATCSSTPYAFHPMYSTSSEHTRVPWAAHSYNVAFSDEIGHFEYCNAINSMGHPGFGDCTVPGPGDAALDGDDTFCFDGTFSPRFNIIGCTNSDDDFDGVPYQNVWPGTPGGDPKKKPGPIRFTSPLFLASSGEHRGELHDYSRVAFEADMPIIENGCSTITGAGCSNPPAGAAFYPIYSTTRIHGQCYWQLGGPEIRGTRNNFGGTSTTEFGPLSFTPYENSLGKGVSRANNYRNILDHNPCSHRFDDDDDRDGDGD